MTQYVLVTGASSGIGADIARTLAAEGHNLILCARREVRLQDLAREITAGHRLQVEIVVADLSSADGVAHLSDTISENGWGLNGLVNNAGIGGRGRFADLDRDAQLAAIDLNVRAPADLTHRLLPLLEQGASPFIINVASLAAFQPGPNMAIYYATKAFVLSFSESLTEELRGRISVSALCPGATESEFADHADMHNSLLFKLGTMPSDKVASAAVQHKRRAIVIPGLLNKLTVWLGKISPRLVLRRIAFKLNS
ncbi:oxidoreductase, short chain dehydrogenase/reductase family-like protein [Salinisphaera dokdonensis CL-ES53]|uniref:Oxidoreductase, short chain dehydrogenase/reductase family-like protein n=1 Tax=Salinisphaera dokdonensis CL-ES53 TaxID=1304272 RepID=A0ABV2AVM5_9GAMM